MRGDEFVNRHAVGTFNTTRHRVNEEVLHLNGTHTDYSSVSHVHTNSLKLSVHHGPCRRGVVFLFFQNNLSHPCAVHSGVDKHLRYFPSDSLLSEVFVQFETQQGHVHLVLVPSVVLDVKEFSVTEGRSTGIPRMSA